MHFLMTPVIDARFEPGHRLVNWIVVQFPGHEWAAALAIGAIAVGAATLGVILVSREIANSSAIAFVAGAAFGTWIGWSRIALWWANGAQTLPAIALMAWTIYSALRWDRNGRRPLDLVLTTGLLILAFCFSVRSALVIPIIAVLLVIAQPASKSISLSEIARRLRETGPLLAATTAVMLAFIAKELSTNNALENPLPTPAPGEWVSFAVHWITVGAGAIASNRWVPFDGHGNPLVWVGIAALLAAAAATIRGSRSAVVWGSILVLLLACGMQVATYRLAQLGLLLNEDPRYHEGDILVLSVLLPAAWMTAGRPVPHGRVATGVVLAAFVGFVALWATGWVSSIHALKAKIQGPNAPSALGDIRTGSTAKVAIKNLRSTLAQYSTPDQHSPPSILDDRTPAGFSPFGDHNLMGIVKVFVPNTSVSFFSTSGTPLIVDDQGVARELKLRNPQVLRGDRVTCLKTAKGSGWLGPGSAGTSFDIPRGYGKNGPIVLDFPLKQTTWGGQLALVFLPSESKLPNVQLDISQGHAGIRTVAPAGIRTVVVSAWDGLQTCVTKPRVWEISPTKDDRVLNPNADSAD